MRCLFGVGFAASQLDLDGPGLPGPFVDVPENPSVGFSQPPEVECAHNRLFIDLDPPCPGKSVLSEIELLFRLLAEKVAEKARSRLNVRIDE